MSRAGRNRRLRCDPLCYSSFARLSRVRPMAGGGPSGRWKRSARLSAECLPGQLAHCREDCAYQSVPGNMKRSQNFSKIGSNLLSCFHAPPAIGRFARAVSKEVTVNIQTASLFLDGLVDHAETTDDYALVGTLHVLRQACEHSTDDPSRLGTICRAAELVSEARADIGPTRSSPGLCLRLRSRQA